MTKNKSGSASARKARPADTFDGLDVALEPGEVPAASDLVLTVETPPAPLRKRGSRTPRVPAVEKTSTQKRVRESAVVAAPAIRPAVPIHQIYFRDDQRSSLDPDLIPCNNSGQSAALLEFEVFERLMGQGAVGMGSAPQWGAVSWKFFAKTGLRRAPTGFDNLVLDPALLAAFS